MGGVSYPFTNSTLSAQKPPHPAYPEALITPKIIHFLGYVPFSMGEPFPEKLKAYRKLQGLTQQQLADALGVVLPTVQAWEAGIHQPMSKMRERVEKILDDAATFAG